MTPIRVLLAGLLAAVVSWVPSAASALPPPAAADGVLFYPSALGLLPTLQSPHPCSASVVHSAGRDLLITAAHCVYGTGLTIEFVPGFRGGQAPYGVWQVTGLYVPTGWQTSQNPQDDVAFATVAPLNGRQLEDAVGARPLGTPTVAAAATVSGFPLQSGTPVTCTGTLTLTQVYPTLSCPNGGMTGGVSGGAFVQRGAVVGVIGGLQQGGCSAEVDYSAPFTVATRQLWQRAQAGGPSDLVLPGVLANACVN